MRPQWELLKPGVNPNFYTIGIEHAGRLYDVWPDIQLTTSATLVGQIAARWNIPIDEQHVVPHHLIRASKTCPGNWLDLKGLIRRVPQDSRPASPKVTRVHVLKNVNLRMGAPNVSAPIARVILASTKVDVAGVTVGQNVAGNSAWYTDGTGGFFWAGVTDVPSPVSDTP